jgi:tRNA (guanine37-N1)-methyltransferase
VTPVRIDVLTIFPGMFEGPFAAGMIRKAALAGICRLHVHDLRAWAPAPHRVVDDEAYGGGPGMVLKAEPIVRAYRELRAAGAGPPVLLSPQGRRFDQALARKLARGPAMTLLCGRYEGVDERVAAILQPLEVSIGDFVLTGGELPALVVVDAVVRLLPGVLAEGAAESDSFSAGLLEGPQYTRPRHLWGLEVPPVLLSGDHGAIAAWRRREALRRTWERRPDLVRTAPLSLAERAAVAEWAAEASVPERPPAWWAVPEGDGPGPAGTDDPEVGAPAAGGSS